MFCPFTSTQYGQRENTCTTECMLYIPVSDGYKNPFNNKDWNGCSFSLSVMQITKLQENVNTFLASLTTRP
jgi:hypothetical protein